MSKRLPDYYQEASIRVGIPLPAYSFHLLGLVSELKRLKSSGDRLASPQHRHGAIHRLPLARTY